MPESRSEELRRAYIERVEQGVVTVPDYQVEPSFVGPWTWTEGRQPLLTLRPEAPVGPFADADEFAARCLEQVELPVRVYRCSERPAEVVVPEEYARRLDRVDELHQQVDGDSPKEAFAARLALRLHPLRNRVQAPDLFWLLDVLPDPGRIDRVILLGDANPLDLFSRQIYGEDFRSGADGSGREITLYRRDLDDLLVEDVLQEWAHFHEQDDESHRRLFARAAALERDGYFQRPIARHDGHNWAVHMTQLLTPSGNGTWYSGSAAPLRAVVLGRSLSAALRAVPENRRGPHHDVFSARVDLLQSEILPIARRRLQELAAAGAAGAADLLSHLDAP